MEEPLHFILIAHRKMDFYKGDKGVPLQHGAFTNSQASVALEFLTERPHRWSNTVTRMYHPKGASRGHFWSEQDNVGCPDVGLYYRD